MVPAVLLHDPRRRRLRRRQHLLCLRHRGLQHRDQERQAQGRIAPSQEDLLGLLLINIASQFNISSSTFTPQYLLSKFPF